MLKDEQKPAKKDSLEQIMTFRLSQRLPSRFPYLHHARPFWGQQILSACGQLGLVTADRVNAGSLDL